MWCLHSWSNLLYTYMPLLLRGVYEIITLYNCWLLVVSDGPTSPGPTNLLYIHAEEEETMIDHLIQKNTFFLFRIHFRRISRKYFRNKNSISKILRPIYFAYMPRKSMPWSSKLNTQKKYSCLNCVLCFIFCSIPTWSAN